LLQRKITTGKQLTREERSYLKRSLLSLGWEQNSYHKWEHENKSKRIEHLGYTLIGASIIEGLIRHPKSKGKR